MSPDAGSCHGSLLSFGRDQRCSFQQPAKIFFARVLMFAVVELNIRGRFVTDFEALKVDDPNVFIAAFPDLSLLKFHGE